MTTPEDSPPSLASLLDTFGVTAVLAVDDEDRDRTFNSELQALQVEDGRLDLTDLLAVEGVGQLIDDRGVDRGDDPTIRGLVADALRSGELSFGTPSTAQGTSSAFAILRDLLDEVGVPFDVVHFDDWDGPDSVSSTTLVLFDFRHELQPQGAQLAVAYATTHGDEARVAILSQEPGDAHELWTDHLVSLDPSTARQLTWIPKASLTADRSVIVEQLAVALTAPLLRRVVDDGVDLLGQALADTARTVMELNPYELHRLSIAAAGDGGFEPESLITRFARRSVPIAVSRMQLRAPVHTAVRQLRKVNESDVIAPSSSDGLIKLQREDYYIDRSHMVGRYQAAVAGDIFAIIDPEVVASVLETDEPDGGDPLLESLSLDDCSLCVLVGQPCDLAVRPDGTRSVSGRWLEALPIVPPGGDSSARQMGPAIHHDQRLFRLPWLLGRGDHDHRRITYKEVLSLPMLAVDACVGSPADAAALTVGSAPSPHLSLNWQNRFGVLADEIDQLADSCSAVSELDSREEAIDTLMLHAAASNEKIGFYYDSDRQSMAWGLVRVARLRSPYVESLLTSYNDFRRRDAFPVSLA